MVSERRAALGYSLTESESLTQVKETDKILSVYVSSLAVCFSHSYLLFDVYSNTNMLPSFL